MSLSGQKRRVSRNYSTLVYSIEETRVIDLNKDTELSIETPENILNYILRQLQSLDPKFNFAIRNLSTIDSNNVQIKQFYFFLIWKELSKENVCQLINDDGYFSSIELLKTPKSWSKYDIDKHVQIIEQKQILNGVSLRDDFINGLIFVVNMDNALNANKNIIFKEIEFDQSTIRLVFSVNIKETDLFSESTNMFGSSFGSVISIGESNLTLSESISKARASSASVLSLSGQNDTGMSQPNTETKRVPKPKYITYILNLTPMIAFTDAKPLLINQMISKLGQHEFFQDYFQNHIEMKFYLLSFNSYKWSYDVIYMEHLMFDYILRQKSTFTHAYKKLILLRKCWHKYFLKFFKIVENIKLNENNNRRVSTSMQSRRSSSHASNTNTNVSLSCQFEAAIERSLPEYLFRVLFLKECSKHTQLPNTKDEFNAIVVTNIFEELKATIENKYCESFLLKNKNIVSKFCLSLDECINIGLNKLLNELYLDWRRGRFGR